MIRPRLQERINELASRNYRYLYVIHCSHTGLRKIGITNDPDARLAQIQADCAWPLTVESLFWVYAPICVEVERFFHALFSHCRHHGEWFELDEDDAKYMESDIALAFNVVNVKNRKTELVEVPNMAPHTLRTV